MAKRKRLSPAAIHTEIPLETKSAFAPPALPAASRAPIADVARDASTQAALEALSDTMAQARNTGRMVLSLPLGAIVLDHLVRDRVAVDDAEMTALKASLRARGQQTPIEVMAFGDGRYGLISGWRRCKALMALHAQYGDGGFGEVDALLRQPEDAAEAYLAMVEENEIRVGLSYFERARIALKSVEQGVFDTQQAALRDLYQSASRAKRSKIGSFVRIVDALDGHLKYPEAIGERFGLALSKALDTRPRLLRKIVGALKAEAPGSAEAELALLSAQVAASSPNKASNIPAKQAPKRRLDSGSDVNVVMNKDGNFALSGAGVDAKLRKALLKWLETYS